MAGETTTTTLADSIAPFVFGLGVGQAVQIPLTYNWLVYVKDISKDPTNTWRSTSRPDIADAVVVSEAGDVTDASMTDDKVDISVQTIARSVLTTYEAQWSTFINEIAQGGQQVSMACKRKIDAIVVTDTTPNLTNEQGDNSVPMTYEQHISFVLQARAQWHYNPPVGSILRCAMHPGPFESLVYNMLTSKNSIFAATFGSMAVGDVINSMNAGARHVIGGVETLVTGRIPAADTTGKGNFYGLVGGETGSCLGLAVKKGITPEMRVPELKLANRGIAYASIGGGVIRDEYGMIGVTAAA